jgi:hypothetical protein
MKFANGQANALFNSLRLIMRALCTFACILFFSAHSHSQEQGRVYLDHMSLVAPANWELDIASNSISLTAPMREPTLYTRCSITINAAGAFAGETLELLTLVDQNIPANLVKQPASPVETLSNGWNATSRIYRNRYGNAEQRSLFAGYFGPLATAAADLLNSAA